MKKNACLLYLLLIIISACTNTQSRRVQTDEIYIAQSGEKVLKMSELVKNIRYVKLETTSDNLIGTVSQLIPLKNKYLVVDNSASKQVLLFDATECVSSLHSVYSLPTQTFLAPSRLTEQYIFHQSALYETEYSYKHL